MKLREGPILQSIPKPKKFTIIQYQKLFTNISQSAYHFVMSAMSLYLSHTLSIAHSLALDKVLFGELVREKIPRQSRLEYK
jgi:hypothetical protein